VGRACEEWVLRLQPKYNLACRYWCILVLSEADVKVGDTEDKQRDQRDSAHDRRLAEYRCGYEMT
jgi:hypothetical protein